MLKSVFEMRDLGQSSFGIGLQLEHLPTEILLHQSTYTRRLLQQFCMHTKKLVKSPMDFWLCTPLQCARLALKA
jgi:hypothetical protein